MYYQKLDPDHQASHADLEALANAHGALANLFDDLAKAYAAFAGLPSAYHLGRLSDIAAQYRDACTALERERASISPTPREGA